MGENDSELLAYVRSDDVRLIRRTHRIGLRIGDSLVCVLAKLREVPGNANLDEVVDCRGDDGDITTIEFHEEYVDRVSS